MGASTVVAIQTQGRANMDRMVWTYRMEYSPDCATFIRVLDVSGNNRVWTSDLLFRQNQNLTYHSPFSLSSISKSGKSVF